MMNKSKKAFGLIEVLLASVIIITLIMALIFLSRMALSNISYLQERSQATFIAQDGIEIVRQIRDTNYIDSDSQTLWNSLVDNTDLPPKRVEPTYGALYYVYFNKGLRLTSDPGELNEYTRIGLSNLNFTRSISFEKVPTTAGDNIMEIPKFSSNSATDATVRDKSVLLVTVKVLWTGSAGDREIEIKEIITDSRQGF